jgi:hypothetical protein
MYHNVVLHHNENENEYENDNENENHASEEWLRKKNTFSI